MSAPSSPKTNPGNFFEDFRLGQQIRHATPRTITVGDVALYNGLFGARFAVQSSDAFAKSIGYPRSPIDDLLVFHVVFGKTVPDISLNAVANLGYADCRFLKPVYPGTTLNAISEVIGLRENSNKKTGIVYVRSRGLDQTGDAVSTMRGGLWCESATFWPLHLRKKCLSFAKASNPHNLAMLVLTITTTAYDNVLAGSSHRFSDYKVGEKIDHVDGITVEEAEHQIATRLYQNTARIHFNQFIESKGRFGRRLIYGGHVISLARVLSFNGLGNAFHVAAINGGRHAAPLFAGDTVFAWSEVIGRPNCRAAMMSARCVCGPSRPRIVPAQISRLRTATTTIRP